MGSFAAQPLRWDVVVPVKPPALGKSRLGASPGLALAIAADTIEAVRSSAQVGRVLVVGVVPELAAVLTETDAPAELVFVAEPAPRGIAAAVTVGMDASSLAVPRAVLLGDLPALAPAELEEAFALAAQHPAAFVADAEGTGTVLVTALPGVPLREAFGAGSAAAHRSLGLVELAIPLVSGLRRDLDTAAQLQEIIARTPTSRTARAAQPL